MFTSRLIPSHSVPSHSVPSHSGSAVLCIAVTLALANTVACAAPETATVKASEQAFVHRVRAEGNLVAVESTVIGVPSQVRQRARVAWIAEDGMAVDEGAVILKFDARDMERNLQNAQGDLTKARHEGTKTVKDSDTQLTELEKNREIAELELNVAERFQFQDDQVFSRNQIIESQIDGELAQTRKTHATEVGTIRKELRRSDTALVDISRRLAEQRITEAEEGLTALEVRAPHPGILTWTRDWSGEPIKVGSEVWQGRELGKLPRLDEMQARVFVLEADASGIALGQAALVTVVSRPESTVEATVTAVDAVSQQPFRGSPVRYFGVTLTPIETDPTFMKPGQRVSALVYIEDRELALVVPRQAVLRDGNASYVFKRDGKRFERTEVEVGPRSIALAVIESGLSPGDEIAIEQPQSTDQVPPSPIAAPDTTSQTAGPTAAP